MTPDGVARLEQALDALRLLGRQVPLGASEKRTFGRFRLLEVLGQGKFGIVFLAEDPQTPRLVALKLPQPAVLLDPGLAERFRRDAEAAGPLDHPGIVPVLEAGSVGGVAYLAMPYISGPTLAAWLREQSAPVPIAQAVDLLLELGEAVHHAHERGVLHCDLKPANVLLGARGGSALAADRFPYQPRISDFGLARLLFRPVDETQTHLTAGTPPYMAPEQILGARRDLTARCDVHALAVILYEVLTGTTPYATSSTDRLNQLLDPGSGPVSPRQLRPEVPLDLEAIVLRGMEKAPERRYASVRELTDDLWRFREGRPTVARPIGLPGRAHRWIRRHPLLACCLVALAVTLVLGLRLATQEIRHRYELELAGQAAEFQAFHALLERIRQRRLEQSDHWVETNLADLRRLAALPPARDYQPALRSEAAAALAAPRLRLVRELGVGKNAYVCAFAPDGATLALGERYPELPGELRVWLVDVTTGAIVHEWRYPVDEAWEARNGNTRADGARSLVFSPRGDWLVLGTRGGRLVRWAVRDRAASPVVWTAHTGDGGDHRADEVRSLLFTQDGTVLLSGSVGAVVRRWSVEQAWKEVGRTPGWLPIGNARAATSTWVFQRHETQLLLELDVHSGATRVAVEAPFLSKFTVAPDGQRIAGALTDGGFNRVLLRGEVPGIRRPLFDLSTLRSNALVADMAFTLDGQWILATSTERGVLELWDSVRGALSTSIPLRGGSARLALSPCGRRVAVCELDRTLLYELSGGPVHHAVVCEAAEVASFALSPDGTRLATFAVSTLLRSGRHGVELVAPLSLYQRKHDRFTRWRHVEVPVAHVPARHIALGPDGPGRIMAVHASNKGERGIRDLRGRWVKSNWVADLRIGPDGRVWAAEAGSLVCWDRQQKETVHPVSSTEERDGRGLQVLLPGRHGILAGRRDGALLWFDSQDRLHATWQVFTDQEITCLARNAAGSRVLVGGSLGAVAQVHLNEGKVVRSADPPHHAAVRGVAYLPEGVILTASADCTIRLWDGDNRPLLLLSESAPIASIALSPDQREIYTLVEGEWGVRQWDLGCLHGHLADLGLEPGFPAPAQARPRR